MKTDLKITTSGDGTKSTTTISDVNPEVSNQTLAQFATRLNALTNQTYEHSNRVITSNVDTETYPPTAQEPTLSLAQSSINSADIKSNTNLGTITTNSDGKLYVRTNSTSSIGFVPTIIILDKTLYIQPSSNQATNQTYYIGVTATENYAGKEVQFTVNA